MPSTASPAYTPPPAELRHQVQIRHRIGKIAIDVDFELTAPWTILFGPSGSGKTTILRSIAGLVHPDEACISRSGGSPAASTALVDTHAAIFVPAHQRQVPMATQRANLFPHRTVLENLAYGVQRGRSGAAAEISGLLQRILAEFRIAHLAHKLPRELSGGEAQRVNVARAVACFASWHSQLLLLDEPFTGLELGLRDELLAILTSCLAAARPAQILSVTHDVSEAFQLGAEVIRLNEGRIIAQGAPETVLAPERARLLSQLGGDQLPLRSNGPYLGG